MVSANITQLLATYINALHILHYHNVLDGYGHLSVRNPNNPPTFFMMHGGLAPAVVSDLDDIGEYRVSDAEPVEPDTPAAPSERFIHSEILKRYPGINVVLHGHPNILISYSISDVPLRASIHMAGFLDDSVRIFDITRYYLPNDTQDLLVKTQRLGAALAAEFSSSSSPSGSSHNTTTLSLPTHNLVLMQNHGFTTAATDLKLATYRGIYAVTNAQVEADALQMQHAFTGRAASAGDRGGGFRHGGNGLVYLTPRQARESWETMQGTVERPWGLWEREVRVNPLYVNELEDGGDSGLG